MSKSERTGGSARVGRGESAEDRGPHIVVLASAGTGKTYRLSSRYIELLAKGVDPGSILATTFTRKAAREILERVLERLSGAAVDAKERKELGESIGRELSEEACRELTVKVAKRVHRLQIGTIDSFFANVARSFALDLDVPVSWEMVEDEADGELRSAAVVRAIEGAGLEREELSLLVRMLTSGGMSRGVHASVLRAVKEAYNTYLSANGSRSAWEVFGAGAVRPTDEEVERLRAEVAGLKAPPTGQGTPNKNFQTNLEEIAEGLRKRDWLVILELGLVGKVIADEKEFSRAVIEARVREVVQRVSEAAARGSLVPLRERNAATWEFLHRFDTAYRALKAERRVMRFEDVPRAILEAGVEGRKEDLYFRLDGRIDHVLLDEFQDTSLVQFEILEPILEELLATGDGSRSVLCVGDVKQSLYSWRGAAPELLATLAARWPQFETAELTRNWRSSPVILEAVNRVFSRVGEVDALSGYRSAKAFQEGFHVHDAERADLPGEVVFTAPPEDVGEGKDAGPTLEEFVAGRVERLHAESPRASIAVLTRTNKKIPGLIVALRERGIAAVGERGNPLTDTPAAAAAVSALHLADHPGDSAALFHVANSPLGEVLGVKWRGCKDRNGAEGRWIASRLRMKLERSGLKAVLQRWQRRLEGGMTNLEYERFDQLIDEAGKFEEKQTDGRPEDFVRLVRCKSVEPPGLASGAGTVRVMTIHAAKGLEFDAVVLPELDSAWEVKANTVLGDRRGSDGQRDPLAPVAAATVYPNKELQAADGALKELMEHVLDRQVGEELSSLYVAMTRARRYLEFIGPVESANKSRASSLRVLRSVFASDLPQSKEPWHAGLEPKREEVGQELTVKWAPTGTAPAGRLARRSPSGQEGESRVDLSEVWRAPSVGGVGAKERGTAFHAMFESIEWVDDGVPSKSDLVRVMREIDGSEEVHAAWAEEFAGAVRGEVREVLSRERYGGRQGEIEVRREWTFAVREVEDVVVSGAIDRLVLGMEGERAVWAEIVDFKTDDARDEEGIEASVERYRPQLEAYRRAVGKMFGLEAGRVSASLVFTGPGRVIEV